MTQDLRIIRLEPRVSRVLIIAAALACLVIAVFSVRWHFANAVAPTFDRTQPESPLVADWLTRVGPDDPLTHFSAAVTFETTFNINDLDRSLREYALATAASPNNYLMWLNLGRARNLNGDVAGAEAAFRRALELAPNYSAVLWAYGNFLIRNEKADEGFAMMARAAASNSDYARSAAVTALEIFDGDIQQVSRVLGEGDATNAALQNALLSGGRHEDAVNAWSRISDDAKKVRYRQLSEKIAADLIGAKKFALAARVISVIGSGAEVPTIGQIGNGGFENLVKLRNAGAFEWQIADGGTPQVGFIESQTHSGKYNLAVVFNSFDTSAFRTISQTVVITPGAPYELEGYYRSDVKTASSLRWEIADASTGGTVAKSDPLIQTPEWTQFTIRFTAPVSSDAVIVRFNRDGCAGVSCPTNGTISFDDLALKAL